MTTRVTAVYQNGMLRPTQPLLLAEGEMVEVTIAPTRPEAPIMRPPTPEEEAYTRRVQEARSLEELLAVQATAPPLSDGYDLCQALNANRRATGERLLFPEPAEESNP